MDSISLETRLKIGLFVSGIFSGFFLFKAISISSRSFVVDTSSKALKKKDREQRPSLSSNADSLSETFWNHDGNQNLGFSASNTLTSGVGLSQANSANRHARPRAAGSGSRRPVITPESLLIPDVPIMAVSENSFPSNDVEVWAINESENLLNLIMSIAEEQTLAGTLFIHF